MPEENNNVQIKSKKKTLLAVVWKRLGQIFLGLFLFFTLIYVIFQIPAVQNWAAQKITKSLSETLQTKVKIDRFFLLFIDKLELENFYIEDATFQDTLLFSRALMVDINSNPITLLRKGIIVQDVRIRNAQFTIKKAEGAEKNNLQLMLDKLFEKDNSKKEKKASKPFHLGVEHIYLEDVLFEKDDRVRGQRLKLYVGRGEFEVNELSLPENKVHISTFYISDPVIEIDEFPEVLPPEWTEEGTSEEEDSSSFHIYVDQFSMENGQFDFNNYRRSPTRVIPNDQIDYDHMQVREIDLLLENFDFDVLQHDYKGQIRNFAFRENSGFRVNSIKAEEASVNAKQMVLNNFRLITPFSTLGDTLVFNYDTYYDYKSFVNKVKMKGYINQSSIAIKDIITFAPALEDNTFFRSNKEQILDLQAYVSGSVNNLRGRKLDIRLADQAIIKGRFDTDSLAVRDKELIQLKLDQLNTSIYTLRQLIPGFDLPENFNKLGNLNFKGRFTGFFADFVAEGSMITDIGAADMNMHMNLNRGRDEASYNGNLSLKNFDLGTWFGNKDLGVINVTTSVNNGIGLSIDKVKADLSADIANFTFKDYTYENAKVRGVFAQNLFDGTMEFKDDNVDFKFRGEVNFQDSVPKFDFYASINRLALKQVNLSQKDMVLSGEVAVQLQNQKNLGIIGEGSIADLLITYNQKEQYQLKELFANLDYGPSKVMQFNLRSDLIDADLIGQFDILEIPTALIAQIKESFPGITYHLGLKDSFPVQHKHAYSYEIRLKDSKGFHNLFDEKLGLLKEIELDGYFDHDRDSLRLQLNIPDLAYGEISLRDIALNLNLVEKEADLGAIVGETIQNGKELFPRVTLFSFMNGDTVDFGLNYAATSLSLLDDLNLNGRFAVKDSSFMQIKFDQSNLAILQKPWTIDQDNSILFSKDSIFVEDFRLRHLSETVSLKSLNGKSVKLELDSFSFNIIDELWDYDPFDFEGLFGAKISVRNIFELSGIQASVSADTLFINDDDWGKVRIDLDAINLQSALYANANITKGSSQILLDGFYNLPNKLSGKNIPDNQQANYFSFNTEIYNFPIDFSKYFIGSNVSNILGRCEADVQVSGFPEQPSIAGFLRAYDGAFTIDYLNTRYRFEESFVNISNQLFDATGTILLDINDNPAVIYGGITHDYLKDLGLNARLKTDNFLAMSIPKSRNELYYGRAFGAGNILFTGDFERTDIYVDATVGDSTELYIPIQTTSGNSNIDFIDFVDKYNKNFKQKSQTDEADNNRIKGLSLDMNLNVTEKAKVEIIFNEQAGDKISGKGRGNLQILIPRGNAMQMFGNYIIEEGDYLFTLYNIASKKFSVKRGGTITWTGDPFGANINIEAQYGDIRTSVANFIPEYLISSSGEVINEASQATKIDLSLKLNGELLKPVINFDIKFPNVKGRLGTFLESKMRTLKQDLNGLNRQVFGLIVVGQFLPSDFAFTGTDVIYNTLSEFLTNLFSVLVTELFSEVIEKGNALSGIDFDIAYYQQQNLNLQGSDNISAGDEFQIGQRLNFFNDKLVVYLGGNIEIGNPVGATTGSGTFIGNDLVVEYTLNEDRSMKLRFYQRLEPDVGGGRKLQVGTGLSFRREFDTFTEFWENLRKDKNK